MDDSATPFTTMNCSFVKSTGTAIATAALTLGITFAAPYAVGSKVEPFNATDQFEAAFTFKPSVDRYLPASHDMETGTTANAVLSPLGKDFLVSKKAVYMANIFGMPGIGRTFAMPKMKKYNHRIILADDATLIANFPVQAGKATVLTLSGGKVGSSACWNSRTDDIGAFLK